MPSFNLLNWTIDMEHHTKDEFKKDVLVKSKFIHEYIHYLQTLACTIGRIIFAELIRISIRAGLHKKFGVNLPSPPEQINLWEILDSSTNADFVGTDVKTDFHDFFLDLQTAVSIQRVNLNVKGNNQIVEHTFKIHGREINNFPFIRKDFDHVVHWIPITDTILYENMARQIQKQFYAFNNQTSLLSLDATIIDSYRNNIGEIYYTCLYDYLEKILLKGEDVAKWTIAICQFSLMCSFPGKVFKYLTELIESKSLTKIDQLISLKRNDPFISSQYNIPNVQETINEMIFKYGSFILPTENYEIRELSEKIANVVNTVNDNWDYFNDSLIKWEKVEGWIRTFGCPPIRFADGDMNEIAGVKTNDYWHKYLIKTIELLS